MAAAVAQNFARSVLRHGQEVVIPRWWTGRYVIDPSRFVVDGRGKISSEDLHSQSALGQEMQEKYHNTGVVHVQNTGLTSMVDQRSLARIVMGQETEYEGGANPRGRTADLGNVYDIGAPLQANLHYHHEMTYKSHSVTALGFLCKHAMNRGEQGWSFVSDSAQAHDYLMETDLGLKLKDKGLCFIRRMTDAEAQQDETTTTPTSGNKKVYNHWQKSWMTNDPQEAEEAANKQGLQVDWIHDPVEGRIMKTRYYKSAFEYIPSLDRNILVTSIADDGEWFDNWPGICEIPQEQRPLEMLFGDDDAHQFGGEAAVDGCLRSVWHSHSVAGR